MIFITSSNGIDPQLLSEMTPLRENQFLNIAQIDEKFVPQEDILFVRADVWFSKKALSRIRSSPQASNEKQVIRINHEGDSGLAIFYPVEIVRSLSQQFSKATFQQVIDKASQDAKVIEASELDPESLPLRVRDRVNLAAVESQVLYERACELILAGVKIRDPKKVFIYGDLKCGAGVQIDLDVIFEGQNILADGVHIGAHCILKNAIIGAKTRINPFSIVEDASVGANSFVGPYGRVRPGSMLGDSVQIGNFVEIKNSAIEAGTRINHLAFIGDSTVGKNVTLGAGVITCNHNGTGVSRTHIEEGAYVGSGCELVAPITIGENATIGAGSTVTEDVPPGKLTLARARQVTVQNWSRQKDSSKK